MSNQTNYNNAQYAQAGAMRYRQKPDGRYGMPQQMSMHNSHSPYIQTQGPMHGHPQQVVRGQMQHGGPRQNPGRQQMMQQQMMQQQMMMQQPPQQQPAGVGNNMVGRDGISLDMNEFPSLGETRPQTTYSAVATVRNNMFGDSQRGAVEFDLNEASFPSLSAANSAPSKGGKSSRGPSNSSGSTTASGPQTMQQSQVAARGSGTVASASKKGSIGQYGITGLLDVIRTNDPALHMLTLGMDLSSIGLNINSQDYLHTKFSSPWTDGPTTGTPGFVLPMCYQMGSQISSRTQHFPKFHKQSLFYIFYTMPLDVRQGLAALQLYKKGWRFHKQWKLWFAPNPNPADTAFSYLFFDLDSWEERQYEGEIQGLVEGFVREEELQFVLSKINQRPVVPARQVVQPTQPTVQGGQAGAPSGAE